MKKLIILALSVLMLLPLVSACKGDDPAEAPEEKAEYTVSWIDENGQTLKTEKITEGAAPAYTYEKQDTAEWDYTVEGWATSASGDPLSALPGVTSDVSYYAIVSKVKQKYTLTFDCGENEIIAPITKEYGESFEKPEDPTLEGFKFMAWYNDADYTELTEWPITVTGNVTVYAKWNEIVDLKALLSELLDGYKLNPMSYIPETMQKGYSANLINGDDALTDYSSFVDVDDIAAGGFGEQWKMVIDNLGQSMLFFNALGVVETISSTVAASFNNYFDSNPADTAEHSFASGIYNVTIICNSEKIMLTIDYTAEFPVIGEQTAQIYFEMNRENKAKSVRVQLGNPNALYYTFDDNSYTFAIKYLGVRRAHFSVSKDAQGKVEGHINEFLTYQGKGIKSTADFYIEDGYLSVVGNKASGLIAFDNYITELYNIEDGKMLGYEVREEATVVGKSIIYNTLWFNLSDVEGIESIKYVTSDSEAAKLFVNGSSTKWEAKKVGGASLKTASRRFDIEFRTQYFYSYNPVTEEYTEYAVSVPMLFVQEECLDTLESDVKAANNIQIAVTLDGDHLEKLMEEYDTVVDVFIENKEAITEDYIIKFIGEPIA